MGTVIDVQNLCVSFDGRTVLDDVSLSIAKGDFLCIVGKSGRGKSTLIRYLLGQISPQSGQICFGEGISPQSIGYLPQQSERPAFPASVREIVQGGIKGKKRFLAWLTRAERLRAEEAMMRMDVLDIADRKFADLSGGQRQRVLLARTLCACEGLLVLDEPVTGLDAVAAGDLLRMLRYIHATGATVVLSANDARVAMQCATRILELDGKVLFNGTVQQYLRTGRA